MSAGVSVHAYASLINFKDREGFLVACQDLIKHKQSGANSPRLWSVKESDPPKQLYYSH